MLRRVSPEGRAIAYRERAERQRRTTLQLGLVLLIAALVSLALFALAKVGIAIGPGAIAAGLILFLISSVGVALGLRPRSMTAAALPTISLPELPPRTAHWLEERRNSLPPPALPLVDSLSRRLSMLGPQLEAIEPNGPGAAAVRKLIAVELPELIERYTSIPSAIERSEANGQLVDGLSIIDGEVGRLCEDLASGSFDALATQNRYLQLKYEAGLSGS